MILPTPQAADWVGWTHPLPRTCGDNKSRTPVVTQEWKPGHDPVRGQASGASANHLGVDLMYTKLPDDPRGTVKHDASRVFIAPAESLVLCVGPGQVWGTYHSDFYGNAVLVDHGTVNPHLGGVCTFYQHLDRFARAWQKGDQVCPGEVLGVMGFAPGDPEGLRHLHFELRFPRQGVPQDDWRIDPEPYMKFWRRT